MNVTLLLFLAIESSHVDLSGDEAVGLNFSDHNIGPYKLPEIEVLSYADKACCVLGFNT